MQTEAEHIYEAVDPNLDDERGKRIARALFFT